MATPSGSAVGSISVPTAYQGYIQQMASDTGLPYSVIAAQANAESGFNANAVSSAGAEGWLQFLPSTYSTYAAQAGVSSGSEFDPASEAKVYSVFMKSLLSQEGGNVRNALAAYNAGPGNIQAGYGYADSILSASGSGNITVPTTAGASTTGIVSNLVGGLSVSGIVTDGINAVLKMLGLGNLKDMIERLGLVILGFVLVIVGIHILSSGSGGSGQPFQVNTSSSEDETGTTTNRSVKTPVSKSTTTRATKAVGASDAVEAAAVA